MSAPDGQAVVPKWGQVALATVAQNVATGLVFGSFGTLVLAIEHDYGASRSQSSLALSLAVLSLSLTAMVMGRWIDRADLRRLMMLGAVLDAAGFLAAALSRTPPALLAAYGLLIGPGTALLGVLPSMTLATRSVPERLRGRALGLVNMPLAVMLVPLAIAPLLPAWGSRGTFVALAGCAVMLLPVLLLVRSGPVAVRQDVTPGVGIAPILRRPAFWVLTLAVGLVVGAGTMKLAHFIPLLMGQGRSFNEANLLLALSGGTGLIGSLLFGLLADRIGGVRALALNAGVQAVVWTIFLAPVTMPILVLDAIVVGACGGGVQAAFGAAVARLFGPRAFGRAFSLFQLSTLPFLFGMTPLASILYQGTGSYHLPMIVTIAGLALAGVSCLLLARDGAQPREEI